MIQQYNNLLVYMPANVPMVNLFSAKAYVSIYDVMCTKKLFAFTLSMAQPVEVYTFMKYRVRA